MKTIYFLIIGAVIVAYLFLKTNLVQTWTGANKDTIGYTWAWNQQKVY